MRFDERHGGEPAAVGNSGFAGAAVVVGDILDQPVDCVVRVGAFVDRVRVFGIARVALHDERAFGAVAAADVLKDEDVAVGNHLAVEIELPRVAFLIVCEAVGSAREEEWERLLGVFRDVNFGVELDAVARGNHHVGFAEYGGVVGRLGGGAPVPCRCEHKRGAADCERDEECA